MKNIRLIYIPILTALFFSACTQVIDIKPDDAPEKIVIEGLVTNEVKPFEVKLSKTLALDDGNAFPVVNNAFITIADNTGNLDTLFQQADGVYRTVGPRQGVPGRTYFLTIKVNENTYTAQDYLTSVPAINAIDAIYLEKGDKPFIDSSGYYISFFFVDSPSKDYYMVDLTKDGVRAFKSNQLYIFDDLFLEPGKPIPVALSKRFASGEKAVVTFSSLSKKGYDYLNGVSLQLQNDGGFFGTPPANAPNNLSGGALGFFRASSITADSLIVP